MQSNDKLLILQVKRVFFSVSYSRSSPLKCHFIYKENYFVCVPYLLVGKEFYSFSIQKGDLLSTLSLENACTLLVGGLERVDTWCYILDATREGSNCGLENKVHIF